MDYVLSPKHVKAEAHAFGKKKGFIIIMYACMLRRKKCAVPQQDLTGTQKDEYLIRDRAYLGYTDSWQKKTTGKHSEYR